MAGCRGSIQGSNKVGQVSLDPRTDTSNLETRAMDAHPYYFDNDQFYDLSVDPTETNNLARNPEYAARISEMQAGLLEYIKPLPGGWPDLGR